LRDESAPEKLEARCGRRTSSPVDARASSIFLVCFLTSTDGVDRAADGGGGDEVGRGAAG
jgi:hypothetical protein